MTAKNIAINITDLNIIKNSINELEKTLTNKNKFIQ